MKLKFQRIKLKKKRNKYEAKKNMNNRGRAAKNSPSKINAKKIFEDFAEFLGIFVCLHLRENSEQRLGSGESYRDPAAVF